MKHASYQILNEFADDELDSTTSLTVAAHLEQCPHCRHIVADLKVLRSSTNELPDEVVPTPELWVAVQRSARSETAASQVRQTRRNWLIAASLVAVSAAVVLTRVEQRSSTPVVAGEPTVLTVAQRLSSEYEAVASELIGELENRSGAADAIILEVVRNNVREMDAVIAQASDMLAAHPDDEDLGYLLARTHEHRLRVLRWALTTVEGA